MKRKLSLLLVVFFLVGCAGLQMRPEDMLYRAEALYNAQRMDYMTYFEPSPDIEGLYVVKPGVTEDEREILRERKKVLDKFEKAIKVYRMFVKSGEVPSYESEQALISFIRQFDRRY